MVRGPKISVYENLAEALEHLLEGFRHVRSGIEVEITKKDTHTRGSSVRSHYPPAQKTTGFAVGLHESKI